MVLVVGPTFNPMEVGVRKFLPVLLAIMIPLAACDDVFNPDDPDGSYEVIRVTLGANGQSRTASPSVVLYEGTMLRGITRYNVRYELIDAQIDLDQRFQEYSFTGAYRLSERDGRFPTEFVTSTEYGEYDVFGGEIEFDEDFDSESYLDSSGALSGRRLEVGVRDPIFGERDFYEFRR